MSYDFDADDIFEMDEQIERKGRDVTYQPAQPPPHGHAIDINTGAADKAMP